MLSNNFLILHDDFNWVICVVLKNNNKHFVFLINKFLKQPHESTICSSNRTAVSSLFPLSLGGS